MELHDKSKKMTDAAESHESVAEDLDLARLAKDAVTRRGIFGLGAAGLLSMVAAACSDGVKFASRRGGSRADETPPSDGDAQGIKDGNKAADAGAEKGPVVEAKAQDAGTGTAPTGNDVPAGPVIEEKTEKVAPCDAPRTNKLSLGAVDAATGDLIPTVKIYGSAADSSMIAIGFTTTKDIQNLTLLHEDGTLIALHVINKGDKFLDGAYRAIIIDNINLKAKPKVKLLITLADKRYIFDIAVTYFNTFNNKPVKDLGAHMIPAGFLGNQSVAQIGEGINFISNDAFTYPDAAGNEGARNLQTAQLTATWTQGGGIRGTVTDVLGNTITLAGGTLIQHQTFCTYIEQGDSVYRTMLRVG